MVCHFLAKKSLKKIESDHAIITWRFRGEQAGFFDTQLLITPDGPDFKYAAG